MTEQANGQGESQLVDRDPSEAQDIALTEAEEREIELRLQAEEELRRNREA